MYNVLIAVAIAVVGYGIGAAVAGWLAGFVPALLAGGLAYFLLARRTGQQVQAIMLRAQVAFQTGQMDQGRAMLMEAMVFDKWQFLIKEQIFGQLGQLDYMQAAGLKMQAGQLRTVAKQYEQARMLLQSKEAQNEARKKLTESDQKFIEAQANLEKSWVREWRSRTILALIHHRQNKIDEALKIFQATKTYATKEPLFWAAYAYVLNEHSRAREALGVLGEGLQTCTDSKQLKLMQEALTNQKKPDMTGFGEAWYGFFPEHIPQETLMEMAQKQGGAQPSAPRPIPQKTPPPPRGFRPR